MKHRPSRLRRLDDALADLPLDEPMLLTELDGFLTAIMVAPEAIPQAEWLQSIWGSDESGVPPFDDPLDVQWFIDAVMARYAEIARDLTRGKPQPIFDVDERNGDVLWELWIDGFAEAMALRPENWDALAASDDADVADAMAQLATLLAVAGDDTSLDSMEINAVEDAVPDMLADIVVRLHAAQSRRGSVAAPVAAVASKIGRNDPCPCGSGKKHKRCCG